MSNRRLCCLQTTLLGPATSFYKRHFLQHHFCNAILVHKIILIFHFGQNHRHRPHSCPCRQQQVVGQILFLETLIVVKLVVITKFLNVLLRPKRGHVNITIFHILTDWSLSGKMVFRYLTSSAMLKASLTVFPLKV